MHALPEDLIAIIEAWPDLSPKIRQQIVARVSRQQRTDKHNAGGAAMRQTQAEGGHCADNLEVKDDQ